MEGRELTEILRDAFIKYKHFELFPKVTYGDFLTDMETRCQEWNKYRFTDRDLLIFAGDGNYENFLDIVAALYFNFKICLIHNKLFIKNAFIRLEKLGSVIAIEDDGNLVGYVKLKNDFKAEIIASTSGTTGIPNLVQHRKSNILNNMFAIEKYICMNEKETIYIQRNPIYLSVLTGEILLGIHRGCRFVVKERRVAPNKLISDIANSEVQLLVSVMSYFEAILPMVRKKYRYMQKMKYLQFVGEGGRAIMINELAELLPYTDIIIGYGLTECGPRVSYMSCREMEPKQYLVGRLVEGTTVRIVNRYGYVLPIGEKGIIEIKSNALMDGYVGKEHCREWFKTSDYGWIDEKGYLYVSGRIDDIVVINGVKIPLISIEQELMKSDMLTGVCAFAVQSQNSACKHVNVIVTSEEKDNIRERLKYWCQHNLEQYFWPHKIYVADEFCFRTNGKIDKKATIKKFANDL